MPSRISFIPFFIAIALVASGNATGGEVVLRSAATPVGSIIRLGDVADLHGFSRRDEWTLKLLELAPAPPTDGSQFIAAATVRSIIGRSGVSVSGITVSGSSTVEVAWPRSPEPIEAPRIANRTPVGPTTAPSPSVRSPSTGFRSAGTFAAPQREVVFLTDGQVAAIHEYLHETVIYYLEDQTGKFGLLEVEFDLTKRMAEQLIDTTGELTIEGGNAPWTGNQVVNAVANTKRGKVKLPLRLTVRDLTPVAVVTRPIARGEMLTASHVTFEPAPKNARIYANSTPVMKLTEMVGREASRAIRPGQVLTTDLCLAPTMVRRGQVVSVVVAGGGIRIARQAIAKSDGRMGDVMEVETIDDQQRITARVTGSGELSIVSSIDPPAPQPTFNRLLPDPRERTVTNPRPSFRQ